MLLSHDDAELDEVRDIIRTWRGPSTSAFYGVSLDPNSNKSPWAASALATQVLVEAMHDRPAKLVSVLLHHPARDRELVRSYAETLAVGDDRLNEHLHKYQDILVPTQGASVLEQLRACEDLLREQLGRLKVARAGLSGFMDVRDYLSKPHQAAATRLGSGGGPAVKGETPGSGNSASEEPGPTDSGQAPVPVGPEAQRFSLKQDRRRKRESIGDAGSALLIEYKFPKASLSPSARPDSVTDAIDFEQMTLRAASVRGDSHRYAGTPRQDAYALGLSEDGAFLTVAVADGIGTTELGHLAADIITQSVAHKLAQSISASSDLSRLDWQGVLEDSSRRLVKQGQGWLKSLQVSPGDDAEGLVRAVRELAACTLIAAAVDVRANTEGTHSYVYFRVGDAAARLLSLARGHIVRLGAREEQEEAEGGVDDGATGGQLPLVTWRGDYRPELGGFGRGEALLLMTDGVDKPLGDGLGDVGAELFSRWAEPPSQYNFAASVDFAKSTWIDDRTVVALWPR